MTRKFNGKLYHYLRDYAHYPQLALDNIRRQGFGARATPCKGGWNLWASTKRENLLPNGLY